MDSEMGEQTKADILKFGLQDVRGHLRDQIVTFLKNLVSASNQVIAEMRKIPLEEKKIEKKVAPVFKDYNEILSFFDRFVIRFEEDVKDFQPEDVHNDEKYVKISAALQRVFIFLGILEEVNQKLLELKPSKKFKKITFIQRLAQCCFRTKFPEIYLVK